MPYLTAELKRDVDECGLTEVCNLVEYGSREGAAGMVTYAVFKLMLAFVKPHRRFWTLALVGGAVLYGILEFYRRVVAPYEDQKIVENGDV